MQYRSLTRVTPPTVEPVTLSEAKAHCRVDATEDDAYLATLIRAAREWVEAYLDRTLVRTQWEVRMDDVFVGAVELPRPPMASGSVSVTVGGTALTENQYSVDYDTAPGLVEPVGTVPSAEGITIRWWAGYGESGFEVPAAIRHAMLMLVCHWYDNRSAVVVGSISKPLEYAVESLLASQKWGSYR